MIKKGKKAYAIPKAIKMNGAEAVTLILLKEGVDVVFGYPGGAIMPIYDSLYNHQGNLLHILARHEQGAIHAAQGYARASGKVGVVIATSGPGATNLITGIADALMDSTPLVCITGQVASHLLGTDAFQETDIVGISTEVTKWNYQITDVEEIPDIMAKAFFIARTGRPGPVLVDITKDAQIDIIDLVYLRCKYITGYTIKPKPDLKEIQTAAKLINAAEKPLIVWGQGVLLANAEEELKTLVEKCHIAAAWTILGASGLPTSHPMNVGMLGMHGNYAPNVLTNECDVLIAIGMRFDDRVTGNVKNYAKQAKVIHFEIDPAEVNKNVQVDARVLGDVKDTLNLLLPLLTPVGSRSWNDRFKDRYQVEYEAIIEKELYPHDGGLTMAEVIEQINLATGNNAIIVTDVGQHQMVACRYAKFNQTRSNITSGGLGTMGFSLPAAIGAKLGAPSREVVAIIGDGGYQMTIQELGTILQFNVAVKIVVLNNNYLGMVRQWQELFFEKRYSSTEMVNPDFVTIAKGYGLPSQKVDDRNQLGEAIAKLIECKSASFLEVVVQREGNVFPMIPTGASVSEIRLK